MRLRWVILSHFLEDPKQCWATPFGNRIGDEFSNCIIVGMNAGCQPERCTLEVTSLMHHPAHESASTERPDELRKMFEILRRVRIHPARSRIVHEGAHDGRGDPVFAAPRRDLNLKK